MPKDSKFSINAKNIGSVNVADTIGNITQTFEFSDSPRQSQPKSEEKRPAIADGKSVKVFISYAREDFVIAKKLCNDLKKAGVSTWLDEEDLPLGQDWTVIIPNVISECRFFMALLSSRSLSKTGYVQKEMRIALDIRDQYPPDGIFLIPVRLDNCKVIEPRLKNLNRADLFPDYDEGLRKILRTITR